MFGPDLIIETGKKPIFIEKTEEQIQERLKEIVEAEKELTIEMEKENKKVLALERLKASTNQDIIDLLELLT